MNNKRIRVDECDTVVVTQLVMFVYGPPRPAVLPLSINQNLYSTSKTRNFLCNRRLKKFSELFRAFSFKALWLGVEVEEHY